MADFVVVENPFLWVAAAALIVLVYLAASWINKSCFSVLPVGEDSPLKGDPSQHLKVFSPGGEYLGIAASASPFCSKLESYCRMAGIPYSRHSPNIRTAPKGKMPYIEHDGNRFGDSTLIIRYFEQSFFAADGAKAGTTVLGAGARMLRDAAGEEGGKSWTSASGTKYASGPSDPTLPAMLRDSELEPLDLGIATAATVLAEEGLNQRLTMSRWWEPANWHIVYNRFLAGVPEPLRTCIAPVVRRGVWDALWSKGLIRHSPADNLRLVEGQLQALEGLLGAGKARWEGAEDAHPGVWFLLGSRPCAADACLLGMMDNFLNDGMDKPENTLTTPHALPLVNEYVGRLRAAYFPDQAAASPTGPSGHSGSAAPLL